MNKKEIDILILRFVSGEATKAEAKQLELWLSESDANRAYFNKIKSVWSNIKAPEPDSIPDFENFWFKVDAKLQNGTDTGSEDILNKGSLFSRLFGKPVYAISGAIGFALIVLFTCIYLFVFDKPQILYYSTGNGQKLEITLPDGSKVQLNADSKVSFPERFRNSRDISLDGEAYFSVTKNGSPFIVHTQNASVQVKGTKFNVNARNRKTHVMVTEGAVLLKSANPSNNASVLLHAGQASMCLNESAPVKPVQFKNKTIPWLNNIFVFENTPLKEISDELIRHYNINIKFADPSLETTTLTGEFGQQNLEEILKTICLSLNLKYKYNGTGYIIYSN